MKLITLIVISLCFGLSGCIDHVGQRELSPKMQYHFDQKSSEPAYMLAESFVEEKDSKANWDRGPKGEKRISRMIDWVEISRN